MTKNMEAARCLVNRRCFDCDFGKITKMGIVKRDFDYLEILEVVTELGVYSPDAKRLTCLDDTTIPIVFPTDHRHLKTMDMDFTIRFLDWMVSFDLYLDPSTLGPVFTCYATLNENNYKLSEPIYVKLFSWLNEHHYDVFHCSLPGLQTPQLTFNFAKKMQHHSILDLLRRASGGQSTLLEKPKNSSTNIKNSAERLSRGQ